MGPLDFEIWSLPQSQVVLPHFLIRFREDDTVFVYIVSNVVDTDEHVVFADQRDMRDGCRLQHDFLSTEKVVLQIACLDRVEGRHQLGHERFVELFGD